MMYFFMVISLLHLVGGDNEWDSVLLRNKDRVNQHLAQEIAQMGRFKEASRSRRRKENSEDAALPCFFLLTLPHPWNCFLLIDRCSSWTMKWVRLIGLRRQDPTGKGTLSQGQNCTYCGILQNHDLYFQLGWQGQNIGAVWGEAISRYISVVKS